MSTDSSVDGSTAESSDDTTDSSVDGSTAESSDDTTDSSVDGSTTESSDDTTDSSVDGSTTESSDDTTDSSDEGSTTESSDDTTDSSDEGSTTESSDDTTDSSDNVDGCDHNYEEEITRYPTCLLNGEKTFTCSECGDSYTEEIVADLESEDVHNYWPDWGTIVYADCLNGGYEKLTCDNCQKVVEKITEPDTEYGHSWETDMDTYVEPTCQNNGYSKRTCSICGEVSELVLDKETYGNHNYEYDEETYKEATCQEGGYALYTCTVCGDSYEESTDAAEWMHDYNSLANYSFWYCTVCGDSYFYATLENGEGEYYAAIYSGMVFNVYSPDYSFDEYYHFEIVSDEDGVYTITLTAGCECHENNGDTLGLVGGTCTFTLLENGLVADVVAADGETAYSFNNVVTVDYSDMLNGTYTFAPEEGAEFTVKFEDGVIYVLVDTMGLGLSDSFNYSYNPNTGMINSDEGYFFVDVSTGDLYFGRGWLLSPVEEEEKVELPELPKFEIGDVVDTLVVETTDTYMPADLYSFVAEAAGKYAFYFPAGLGGVDKMAVDEWGTTPIFELGYFHEAEEYVIVELDAGEKLEFYIIADRKAEWTITVCSVVEYLDEFNGTYVNDCANPEITFTFDNGVLTVVDNTGAFGLTGTYAYRYNAELGQFMFSSDSIALFTYGDTLLLFGRVPLVEYVPVVIPEAYVGYNFVTIVAQNYFFNGVKFVFVAEEAGTYVFSAAEGEENFMLLVEDEYGAEMMELPFAITLEAGESFEFIVTTSANALQNTEDTVDFVIEKQAEETTGDEFNGIYVNNNNDVQLMFVFEDGVLYVEDTTGYFNIGGIYGYEYDAETGAFTLSTDAFTLNVSSDSLFLNGMVPLVEYVPVAATEAVVGNNSVTIVAQNYFFNGVQFVFVAEEAGTYVFSAAEGEENFMLVVEDAFGAEMLDLPFAIILGAGERFEFIVTTSANAIQYTEDTVEFVIALATAE